MVPETPRVMTPEMLAVIRQRLADGKVIVFGHKIVAALVAMLDAADARADEAEQRGCDLVSEMPCAGARRGGGGADGT